MQLELNSNLIFQNKYSSTPCTYHVFIICNNQPFFGCKISPEIEKFKKEYSVAIFPFFYLEKKSPNFAIYFGHALLASPQNTTGFLKISTEGCRVVMAKAKNLMEKNNYMKSKTLKEIGKLNDGD